MEELIGKTIPSYIILLALIAFVWGAIKRT